MPDYIVHQPIDARNKDVSNIRNLIQTKSVSTNVIDFANEELQTISISANTVFTTTNLISGKSKVLEIATDGTLRTLTFPASWKWASLIPTDQDANTFAILTLTLFGPGDVDVRAAYKVFT